MSKAVVTTGAFDIGALDTISASSRGAEIELTHPVSGKGLGIFVTILGQESEEFREYMREKENAGRHQRFMAERTGKPAPLKLTEELENEATELLCICTLGWRSESYDEKGVKVDDKPIILDGGEELSFNVVNATRLYNKFTWMRKQVDAAIGNLSLFIKP